MKKNVLGLIIVLVGFAVYNLFMFMIVKDYSNLFWISYIFTTIAFVAQIIVDICFNKAESDTKFLSLPMFYIVSVYFLLQLIAGVVCTILPFSVKVAIIIQVSILAGFIVIFAISLFAQDYIKGNDKKVKNSTSFICNLTREAESLYLSVENGDVKKELKKLYEAIRYSDPISTSNEEVELDERIRSSFSIVRDKIESGMFDVNEDVKSTLELITKRNLLCKMSK